MGKLKLLTIIGTRPEIIRLSATIKCCDRYFEQILRITTTPLIRCFLTTLASGHRTII